MDMGVEPYLIASSLLGILSQRLVRVLCPKCKKMGHPEEGQIRLLGSDTVHLDSKVGCQSKGCKFCAQTGFKGRVGIFEFLVSTPEIKELITLRQSTREIAKILRANGFKSIREEGIEKAVAGVTTLDEVLRQTI